MGSISAATGVMGRNQPALSNHIKCLEELFGVDLFERGKSGRQLTDDGKLLLERAITIFDIIKETKETLAHVANEIRGEITISCPYMVLEHILPTFILEFRSRHPLINFKLEGGSMKKIVRNVQNEECDFGLTCIDRLEPGLAFDPLFTSSLSLITPKEGPNAINSHPTLRQISQLDFISFPPSIALHHLIHRQFANEGLSLRTVFELDNYNAIKKITQAGLGVSIFDSFALDKNDKINLNIFELDEHFPPRVFGAIYRQDAYMSPSVKEFLRFIKCQLR